MYGSYESSQCVEVMGVGNEGKETEFQFTLNCVTLGCAGQFFGPPEDCYPAEAAEFELDSLHVLDDDGNPVKISENVLEAIVGKELARKMYWAAEQDAIESGEF